MDANKEIEIRYRTIELITKVLDIKHILLIQKQLIEILEKERGK